MKKKVFFILITVIVLRLLNIFIINTDPEFFLSPRNFNGRGLIAMPSWIDFLIPVIVILFLYNIKNKITFKLDYNKVFKALSNAFILIFTPIIIGVLLNNYIQKTSINIDVNSVLIFRYILFILTFIAINIFADALLIKSKFLKYLIFILFLIFIAYTQDIFSSGNKMNTVLGLINSVGTSTVIIAIGLRRIYKQYQLETITSVLFIGLILIFFKFNVLSISFFTIFLPFIAFFLVGIILYNNWKLKTKIIIGIIPFIIALFLNFVLPAIVPSDIANELVEKRQEEKFFEEQVGNITVKYKEKRLRNISLRFAKVLDEANQICNNELGISPNVNILIIRGIAPGGFHAEFSNRIVGNIISEKYLDNCADSTFLNNPELAANFPDPVNAILHEYSHLFGVVTYHKWWPGAEEEGWATYSATQISILLYNKLGADLWQPAYNYSKQADKIIKQNLSGKAVVWSHPNEFGGFNLWYHLGNIFGIKKMYNLRWQNTKHNIQGSLYMISNPKSAKQIISVFGKKNFLDYGQMPIKKFNDIYSIDDYLYLAKTTGIDIDRINKMFEFMKYRDVNPTVPVP